MNSDFKIVKNGEHYDVFVNGVFICSADNINEASMDIEEYMNQERS